MQRFFLPALLLLACAAPPSAGTPRVSERVATRWTPYCCEGGTLEHPRELSRRANIPIPSAAKERAAPGGGCAAEEMEGSASTSVARSLPAGGLSHRRGEADEGRRSSLGERTSRSSAVPTIGVRAARWTATAAGSRASAAAPPPVGRGDNPRLRRPRNSRPQRRPRPTAEAEPFGGRNPASASPPLASRSASHRCSREPAPTV